MHRRFDLLCPHDDQFAVFRAASKDGRAAVIADLAIDYGLCPFHNADGLGSTIVEDPDAIYDVDCDIFAPCALGGSINSNTIDRLRCKMVAGSANNQLLTPEDGEALWKKGVLYVPDYVLNAGGVINLSYEIGRPYQEEEAMSISKDENISTAKAADWLAEMRIKSVRRAKGIYLAP